MGDFNIDLLKVSAHSNNVLNFMFSSSFYPIITKPTRITETTATLTDNIYVNKHDGNFKMGLLLTDLSDHLPVSQLSTTGNMKTIGRGSQEMKNMRIINEKTINNLCEELDKIDFNDICGYANPKNAYNLFHYKLTKAYNKCLHLVCKKGKYHVHPKTPWITKGILKSRETKNKLNTEKYRKVPKEINEKVYNKYRHRFNKVKSLAKKSYYNRKFNEAKGNISATWT